MSNINKKFIVFGAALLAVVLLGLGTVYFFVRDEPEKEREYIVTETPEPTAIRTDAEEEENIQTIIDTAITDKVYDIIPYSPETYKKLPELTEVSYNKFYDKIILFAEGRNWDAIQSLADQITSGYQINNGDWSTLLYTCSMISDLKLDVWDRQTYLSSISDPKLFIAIFTSLPIEEQAAFLPSMDISVLPNTTDGEVKITSTEDDVGAYYSEAYRYYSDFENTKITKISVKYENGITYDIYFATNPEYGIANITNITNSDKSAQVDTTYKEYFEFSGTEPCKIIYD